MTLDVATRLLCAAHDEWDISEESRALAADALAALKAAEAAARGAAFREREAANEAAMLRAQVAALRLVVDHGERGERDDRAQWAKAAAKYLDAHGHEPTCMEAQHPGHPYEGCNCVVADIERGCMGDVAHTLGRIASERDALTARVVDAEGEAALVAIGAALGREGATAGECVAAIGELRARLTAALVACGAAGAERAAADVAWARADRSAALYQSVVQPALETLALCGEAMTAGLAECERLRARCGALRTMLAAARRKHDAWLSDEDNTDAPGPESDYLEEIDRDLAALDAGEP